MYGFILFTHSWQSCGIKQCRTARKCTCTYRYIVYTYTYRSTMYSFMIYVCTCTCTWTCRSAIYTCTCRSTMYTCTCTGCMQIYCQTSTCRSAINKLIHYKHDISTCQLVEQVTNGIPAGVPHWWDYTHTAATHRRWPDANGLAHCQDIGAIWPVSAGVQGRVCYRLEGWRQKPDAGLRCWWYQTGKRTVYHSRLSALQSICNSF